MPRDRTSRAPGRRRRSTGAQRRCIAGNTGDPPRWTRDVRRQRSSAARTDRRGEAPRCRAPQNRRSLRPSTTSHSQTLAGSGSSRAIRSTARTSCRARIPTRRPRALLYSVHRSFPALLSVTRTGIGNRAELLESASVTQVLSLDNAPSARGRAADPLRLVTRKTPGMIRGSSSQSIPFEVRW